MAFLNFTPEQLQLLTEIVTALVIVAAMILADLLARRAITRYSKQMKLQKHLENIFKLLARILIVAVGLIALLQLFGLPDTWFLSVSALAGAAIGFASTQTVGNFLAGVYLMVSRPFLVNDYVKIGDVEGQVREITVNYTEIYTPTYNLMEIPNRKVLDSKILNYSTGDVFDYTFQVGFPHDIPNEELINKCIVPAIEKFYEKHKDVLPRKPEFSMSKMDRLGRTFAIRVFFPEKKTKTFYDIQPELLQDIVKNWDNLREQKK
jgi:small conductance mechanosensitive channel